MTFEDCYKNYRQKFLKMAYCRLKNKSNAEDLVQDIFLKALIALRKNPLKHISLKILKFNLIKYCVKNNRVTI